ncbi:MAG: HupE/UreJ family protein [Verrucomicrobia bacterium]|nr:HupE/UreJ family protein [Verrucomicrobiota bacterium]
MRDYSPQSLPGKTRRVLQARVGPRCGLKEYRVLWLIGCLLGWLAGLGVAESRAHDPGLSTVQGEWSGDRLSLVAGFAPADVESLLPPAAPRAERWGAEEFAAVRGHLQAVAPRLWEISSDGSPVPAGEATVELLPGDNVSFRVAVRLPPATSTVSLRAARLPELPAGHRQFLIVTDERGSVLAKKLLSARDAVIEVSRGPATAPKQPATSTPGAAPVAEASDLPGALEFVRLGIEHIWTGYDHLLFLFALLVVCRTFRSIVGIVTCFTVAHSLTLALATLEWVSVPARVVEPLVAASIVFVGVENLLSRGAEPKGRWALTFGFGLIHGFGFASVLRDLGLGSGGQGVALPLFTFNLGVELGQIALAGVVMPVVWHLRRSPAFLARGVPAISAVVAVAGLYWLAQRVVFS